MINRLFNHKPFLEAEIRSMVKDYEQESSSSIPILNKESLSSLFSSTSSKIDTKRANNNISSVLEDSFELMHGIKDRQLVAINDYCDRLHPLEKKIDRIEELMEQTLTIERMKGDIERGQVMDQFIIKQNNSLIGFMQQMEQRINYIDSSYLQAREKIYQKYGNEDKQKKTDSPSISQLE